MIIINTSPSSPHPPPRLSPQIWIRPKAVLSWHTSFESPSDASTAKSEAGTVYDNTVTLSACLGIAWANNRLRRMSADGRNLNMAKSDLNGLLAERLLRSDGNAAGAGPGQVPPNSQYLDTRH